MAPSRSITHAGILVDDPGHKHDLARLIEEVLTRVDAPVSFGCAPLAAAGVFPVPPATLFQEPPQSANLLAAVHRLGQLHAVALLSRSDQPDALHRRQRLR